MNAGSVTGAGVGAPPGAVSSQGGSASPSTSSLQAATDRPIKRKRGEKSNISTACLYCRRSKMKCIREREDDECDRCKAAQIECETRARQSGRRGTGDSVKGYVPVRKGALGQMQPERSLSAQAASSASAAAAFNLAASSASSATLANSLVQSSNSFTLMAPMMSDSFGSIGSSGEGSFPPGDGYSANPFFASMQGRSQDGLSQLIGMPSPGAMNGEGLHQALFNTSRTSDLSSTSPRGPGSVPSPPSLRTQAQGSLAHVPQVSSSQPWAVPTTQSETSTAPDDKFTTTPLEMLAAVGAKQRRMQNPFSALGNPVRFSQTPDYEQAQQAYFSETVDAPPALNGGAPEFDPLHLALLSNSEAEFLFEQFFANLQPMVHLLDRRIDTLASVRARSSILLTSILSSASKFAEGHATTSLRLEAHFKRILSEAIISGATNLEYVQAILITCPWMAPGSHVSFDQTSTYLSIANQAFVKLRVPPTGPDYQTSLELRAYERAYLTLFNYDRGLALVSGRPWSFTIPTNDLVLSVEKWARDPLAVSSDWTLGALVCIRRDFVDTLALVSSTAGSSAPPPTDPAQRPKPRTSPALVKAIVEEFVTGWCNEWVEPLQSSRAYLSVIGAHTTLSIYIAALQDHAGRPTEVPMLQACLYAGLQTCRACIAGRQELVYVVNNASLMISYCAAFSLKLVVHWKEEGSRIEASVHHVIKEVSEMLVDIGSSPAHRNGRAALYGHRLKSRLRDQASTRLPTRDPSPAGSPRPEEPSTSGLTFDLPSPGPDLVHMSEESLNNLLLNVNDGSWLPMGGSLDTSLFVDTSDLFSAFAGTPDFWGSSL